MKAGGTPKQELFDRVYYVDFGRLGGADTNMFHGL
jgi:hypothetical protein